MISDGFEPQLIPTPDASVMVGVVPLSVVTVVHRTAPVGLEFEGDASEPSQSGLARKTGGDLRRRYEGPRVKSGPTVIQKCQSP